ncbi:hypothetical protein ACFOUS_22240 [Deinococcus metalli]|uniref:hypothetical protein n=1 Tax=Deinococcus metalli TaxID=1141878 RepID=UPI0036230DA3
MIDLAAAVMAGRHQHLALVPLYGVLGVCMLVAHVRRWRWIPGAWDVVASVSVSGSRSASPDGMAGGQ